MKVDVLISVEKRDGWGGPRTGAGRKPSLNTSEQLRLAALARLISQSYTAGTGKRHYSLRQEIISETCAHGERLFGRNVSRNAVIKAWRRYRNHGVMIDVEISVKADLGMIHDMNFATVIPQL